MTNAASPPLLSVLMVKGVEQALVSEIVFGMLGHQAIEGSGAWAVTPKSMAFGLMTRQFETQEPFEQADPPQSGSGLTQGVPVPAFPEPTQTPFRQAWFKRQGLGGSNSQAVPLAAFDQAVVLRVGLQIWQTSAGFGVPVEYEVGSAPGGRGGAMRQLQLAPLQVELQGVTSPPPSPSSEKVMVPSVAKQAVWQSASRQMLWKQCSPSGQAVESLQAISLQLLPPLPWPGPVRVDLGLLVETGAVVAGQPVAAASPTSRVSADIRQERCRTLTLFLPSKPPSPPEEAEILAR
jgi:hypothetical protein